MKLLINQELDRKEEEDNPLTPLAYNREGVGGTLQQVAYYENPGILMIVQSVEDLEVRHHSRGNL